MRTEPLEDCLIRHQFGPEGLDGDFFFQLEVHGPIDHTHATLPYGAKYLVAIGETLPGNEIGRRGSGVPRLRLRLSRGLDFITQVVHLVAQPVFPRADMICHAVEDPRQSTQFIVAPGHLGQGAPLIVTSLHGAGGGNDFVDLFQVFLLRVAQSLLLQAGTEPGTQQHRVERLG